MFVAGFLGDAFTGRLTLKGPYFAYIAADGTVDELPLPPGVRSINDMAWSAAGIWARGSRQQKDGSRAGFLGLLGPSGSLQWSQPLETSGRARWYTGRQGAWLGGAIGRAQEPFLQRLLTDGTRSTRVAPVCGDPSRDCIRPDVLLGLEPGVLVVGSGRHRPRNGKDDDFASLWLAGLTSNGEPMWRHEAVRADGNEEMRIFDAQLSSAKTVDVLYQPRSNPNARPRVVRVRLP